MNDKLSRPLLQLVLLSGLIGTSIRCSSTPEPVLQKTTIPEGVQIASIVEDATQINEITQVKTFDQCSSSGGLQAQVQFSQSDTRGAQQELVLSGSAEGEVGLSEIARARLATSIEKHFVSSGVRTKSHEESVTIDVQPRTKQEYTLVWRESRRVGTVQYIEDGETSKFRRALLCSTSSSTFPPDMAAMALG